MTQPNLKRPLRDLAGMTVAITGASAGVGRATARAVADRGANVAVMARSDEGLADVAEEVRARGGRALPISLDVADAESMFAAVAQIEAELGPIDAWVNNAMATVFSPISRLTPDEVRRVTEVTYLGSVNGAMAALERMRARDRGCIVQVGSALAYRSIPLQAAYCGAKHAIRGFMASLRCELIHDGSRVKVTEVHLPAIDTPQFDWARAHARRRPRPVGDIHRPEVAAEAIVKAILRPRREYWLGASTAQAILAEALWPGMMDRLMARMSWDGQFSDKPLPPDAPDNLNTPVEGLHGVRGRFSDQALASAPLVDGQVARLGVVAGGAAILACAAYLIGRRR